MANILLLLLGTLYKNVNSAVCVIIYYILLSRKSLRKVAWSLLADMDGTASRFVILVEV